jgi:hypothetical protein
MGILMTNPYAAERVIHVVEGLGTAVKDAIARFSTAPAAPGVGQVVRQIPQNAVDATMGQPPPPPNGTNGAGWGP